MSRLTKRHGCADAVAQALRAHRRADKLLRRERGLAQPMLASESRVEIEMCRRQRYADDLALESANDVMRAGRSGCRWYWPVRDHRDGLEAG